MAAHAKLSASGASRWINCPGSVRMEEGFPDKGSDYAKEGTQAHELAELVLRYNNGEISKRTFNSRLGKIKKKDFYNQEMMDYVEDYVHSVWEIVNVVKVLCKDPEILFEQRLDFSDYVPGGFGTGDVVLVADGELHIIDLKYGKGVGVSAEGNPQLRLYGLGAYLEYEAVYDIEKVVTHIIQPRLDTSSSEEISVSELLMWADTVVEPAALLAEAGKGELRTGDHCRWCKAKAICRLRAEENLELTKFDFKSSDKLEDSEIGEILRRAEELNAWAKDVVDYAFNEAVNCGKKWEGWKLVEGRSNRKYINEAEVVKALKAKGFDEAILFERKMLGVTALERVVGKKVFTMALGDLVEKPPGKPVLVKESDKRQELNSVIDDFAVETDSLVGLCLHDMKALGNEGALSYWEAKLKGRFSAETIKLAYDIIKK